MTYRVQAEMPDYADPPMSFGTRAKFALAIVIVAPVRLVQWCWPWLAANGAVGLVLLMFWATAPIATAVVQAALNIAVGIGYLAYRSYQWAVATLRRSEAKP